MEAMSAPYSQPSAVAAAVGTLGLG